ncbi:hypothetical protein M8J77_022452 [Diaphorina citri]|nr:hypothetical protein M8J77_022452 [Diaphorina citri]
MISVTLCLSYLHPVHINHEISWVRHRDIHLLTVSGYTYTSDQRFSCIHKPQNEDWTLQIKYPQKRDSGIYECQVSTTPPIGISMYLSVVGERVGMKTNFRMRTEEDMRGEMKKLGTKPKEAMKE